MGDDRRERQPVARWGHRGPRRRRRLQVAVDGSASSGTARTWPGSPLTRPSGSRGDADGPTDLRVVRSRDGHREAANWQTGWNSLPKYVVSSTPRTIRPGNNSTFLIGGTWSTRSSRFEARVRLATSSSPASVFGVVRHAAGERPRRRATAEGLPGRARSRPSASSAKPAGRKRWRLVDVRTLDGDTAFLIVQVGATMIGSQGWNARRVAHGSRGAACSGEGAHASR